MVIRDEGKYRKITFDQAVRKRVFQLETAAKREKNYRKVVLHIGIPLVLCSKCNQSMDGKIANTQKVNKRENAPICVACIMGFTRVPRKEKIRRHEWRSVKRVKKVKKGINEELDKYYGKN